MSSCAPERPSKRLRSSSNPSPAEPAFHPLESDEVLATRSFNEKSTLQVKLEGVFEGMTDEERWRAIEKAIQILQDMLHLSPRIPP